MTKLCVRKEEFLKCCLNENWHRYDISLSIQENNLNEIQAQKFIYRMLGLPCKVELLDLAEKSM